jgi:hypothetical protein
VICSSFATGTEVGRYTEISASSAVTELMSSVVGCVIAQAGFVVSKVTHGQVFSEYFSFPSVLIPLNAPYSSIIQGWYIRPISSQCTKLTQSHPTSQNLNSMC